MLMQVQEKHSKSVQRRSSTKPAASHQAVFEQCQDVKAVLQLQRSTGYSVRKQVKHNSSGADPNSGEAPVAPDHESEQRPESGIEQQEQLKDHAGIPLSLKRGLETLSGLSLSNVRVHTNSSKPARLNALAYTQGHNIHLGPGQDKQLPHEGWHIVQQMQGRVRPTIRANSESINDDAGLEREADEMGVRAMQSRPENRANKRTSAPRLFTQTIIQRRRVPGVADILDLVWEENAAAHATGLREIVRRAWAELTATQRTAVGRRVLRGFTLAELNALSQADRDIFFAQAIRQEVPGLIHGDPGLYQVGARTGTNDAANITTLVNGANTIFSAIASGSHDASVGQIFGTANITTAKSRYAAARVRMNFLKTRNKIVTDRSGYSGEVGLGGLTNSAQIMVSFQTIDNPTDMESIVTMIHEAMHAGNNSVTDLGYISRANFPRMQEADKLNNAAHYEVVPRRILGTADFTFAGQTFTPAGATTSTGVVTPSLTPREQAVRETSETFRKAWTVGLNLHNLFVEVYRNPSVWNRDISARFGVSAGTTFANSLPFWSKVESLTVHRKTNIDSTSSDVSVHPFSIIDIALSEGLVRKLSQAMDHSPQTEADALALETAHATTAEQTAIVGDINAETDLLIKIILEHRVGQITGGVLRDRRAVKRMAQANNGTFSDMLVNRPPSSFP